VAPAGPYLSPDPTHRTNTAITITITTDITIATAITIIADITIATAIPRQDIGAALKYIALYFGNSALFDNVCAFIVKDLTWQTAPTYYAEADLYKLEKLTAAAASMCALHFPSADHDQLILLKTGLFKTIIESPALRCDSKLLSRRVADYCRAHSAQLTPELLLAITPAKTMHEIAPKEALYLYEVSGEVAKWDHGWQYAREQSTGPRLASPRLASPRLA